MVLQWITEANDLEERWKVAEVFQWIYPGERKGFDSFGGVYRHPGETFTSSKGLTFLLNTSLDQKLPVAERKQALMFLVHALDFVLLDTFQHDDYFRKYTQSQRQQEMLDQLMPLMHEDQLAYLAFINIIKLSHSEDPWKGNRMNLSKIPELMEIYKQQSSYHARFRERFTDFLLKNCTDEQWNSLTGNDAKISMVLSSVKYFPERNLVRFHAYYNGEPTLIREVSKVVFEKWDNGQLKERVIKDFTNEDGSPWSAAPTYLQQIADVGDLGSGKWVFYLSGVAGESGQYRWTSDWGGFEKE